MLCLKKTSLSEKLVFNDRVHRILLYRVYYLPKQQYGVPTYSCIYSSMVFLHIPAYTKIAVSCSFIEKQHFLVPGTAILGVLRLSTCRNYVKNSIFLLQELLFLACYRVAKSHRIPYLYRSFSAKVTYI